MVLADLGRKIIKAARSLSNAPAINEEASDAKKNSKNPINKFTCIYYSRPLMLRLRRYAPLYSNLMSTSNLSSSSEKMSKR